MTDAQIRALADRLARAYAFPGASGRQLEPVLEVCAWTEARAGEQLCEEDDKGASLFFLMTGAVDVFKRDHLGVNQKLTTATAPSLLGHMSLIDRSPRSATCVTASACQVGVMDAQTFEKLRAQRSPSGTAFRRLLLASLNQQLRRGDAQLHALLGGAEPAVERAETQLLHAMSTLDGWEPSGLEDRAATERQDWRERVFADARALPLGPGVRLLVRQEGPAPFELSFEGVPPEEADPIVRRWIRFVHSIPTPPGMILRYSNCGGEVVPRPKALERRLRLYFPAWSIAVTGDEHVVNVAFSNVDARW